MPLHDQRPRADRATEVYAGGLRSNRDVPGCRGFAAPGRKTSTSRTRRVLALFDPQTSGGLLLAVAADRHAALLSGLAENGVTAWTVGEVTAGSPGTLVLEG